ncbi:MAG: 16S rRNA (guanine(527)-N(7))-methyltransferase RsmG [Spongiibacteraceae bacterium]
MITAEQKLSVGITELQLDISAEQSQQLQEYLTLLQKWNQAYNLTAIRDPLDMVSKHLLDSLSIAPYVTAQRCLDVGTGAGLPGIPLAILYPEKIFSLLDSNGKKTRFLIQVKAALGLDNVEVHCERVESLQDERGYDGIFSRAFASLPDMIAGCSDLLAENGRLYAMKGVFPENELSQLPKGFIVEHCYPIQVPTLNEDRHLVVILHDRSGKG